MGEAERFEACFLPENSIPEGGSSTSRASIASTVTEATNENIHLLDTMADPAISDIKFLASEISGKSDIAADDSKAISFQISELAALPSVQEPKDLNCKVQQSNADNSHDVAAINGFTTYAKVKATETRSLVSTYKLQFQTNVDDNQLKDLKAKILRKAVVNRGLIDTAAPFESVKQAVSKFGGTVDRKEKNKTALQELEKVQEEIPKYKKQSENAEVVTEEVLKELESTKRQVDELNLRMGEAKTEEAQAKQDLELAELWANEQLQGINNNSSFAVKAQLEVAKARHDSTVAELILVRQQLEELEKNYLSLVQERDMAIRKAEESESAAKKIEKKVEDLTIDLIATKELIDRAHTAEEKRVNAVLSWNKEKLDWEKELKQAEEELEILENQLSLTNDLKSKLDFAVILLASLKAELAIYNEGEINQEFLNMEMEKLAGHEETKVRTALLKARKELEEVRSNIEKVKDEVDCLKTTESSLKSEIQAEQTFIMALGQKESLASISSLEAELNRINTELVLIIKREKEAIEKAEELPKKMQQAAQEAEKAKAVAASACEELRKAKGDAEQTKAVLSTMEIRLSATMLEIKAAKTSEELATSAVNAIEQSEHTCEDTPTKKVSLSSEEYFKLSKRAQEAEEAGCKKVFSAVEGIKAAKESESKTLMSLQEANKELEEKKAALRAALEKAEKAKESKLSMEEELRQWRTEGEERRKASESTNVVPSEPKGYASETEATTIHTPAATKSKFFMSRSQSKDSSIPEQKPRKKSFFPRILMFLARKKVQTFN